MIRRLGWVLIVAAVVAFAVWFPREDELTAGLDVADAEPLAVALGVTKRVAPPPFAERWELTFPDAAAAAQTFVLDLAAPVGTKVAGRLAASSIGDPAPFLDRLGLVLGAGSEPTPPGAGAPPAGASEDVTLDVLGDRLSYGPGEVGSTVVAGAFAATPPGAWRVYRVTIGAGGPQCFLGVSESAGAARILPRELADAPAIVAAFRRLLGAAPKPRES